MDIQKIFFCQMIYLAIKHQFPFLDECPFFYKNGEFDDFDVTNDNHVHFPINLSHLSIISMFQCLLDYYIVNNDV